MKYCFVFLLLILSFTNNHAQNGIEKLSQNKIDSLHTIHVDTIIHYYSYCGECEILHRKHTCYMLSGYTLNTNTLIYRQKGKYYSLTFDCTDSPVKISLDNCKSIPYYISIIPTLNARDEAVKKKHKGIFWEMSQADGFFEQADIYLNKQTRHIQVTDLEKEDTNYKKLSWANKEMKLMDLIVKDFTVNKAPAN